jgi:hypothetical protein
MTNDSESFEKKGLDFNTAVGPQTVGDSVVSKLQGRWLNQAQGFRIEFGLVQCSQRERCCRTHV